MLVTKINALSTRQNQLKPALNRQKSPRVSTNYHETNLNYNNYSARSIINFSGQDKGFSQTLDDNYFQLPINKETKKPFEADVYQKAAGENLYRGSDVIVAAPTGTGKTAIAHYAITKNLKENKKTFYTAPLKALSNDKIREFVKIYGDKNVGLLTGDRKINTKAPIMIMTTEVYRNMLMQNEKHNPMLDDLKTVVFDELHYLNDDDRGGVWEQSIMFTPKNTQILALSGTMRNAELVADWMSSIKGHGDAEKVTPNENYHIRNGHAHTVLVNVPSEKRHVPLAFAVEKANGVKGKTPKGSTPFDTPPSGDDFVNQVKRLQNSDRLPAIFFIFSKKRSKAVMETMKESGPSLTTDAERQKIRDMIKDFKKSDKYLGELLDVEGLEKGYAIHNAGMLPTQKELIEKLFQKDPDTGKPLVKVVFSTETLSAGINMPARSTVITGVVKPVSKKVNKNGKRALNPNEFHQMAGRAGRRGIDVKGYTYCMAVNKQQLKTFNSLIETPSADINSHLKTDFSFIANMNKGFKQSGELFDYYKKSLAVFGHGNAEKERLAKRMYLDYKNKEAILKNEGFMTRDGEVTQKGELLQKLNGYEQIPVVDAIYERKLHGFNAVQLAGYASILAHMTSEMPRPQEESLKYPLPKIELKDEDFNATIKQLRESVSGYNKNLYPNIDNLELQLNEQPAEHVYKWAELNEKYDDSKKSWHEIIKKNDDFQVRDEGTLFKEIVMTTDLLKQIGEIAKVGESGSINNHEQRYYRDLQKTALEAINLINRTPAKQDE